MIADAFFRIIDAIYAGFIAIIPHTPEWFGQIINEVAGGIISIVHWVGYLDPLIPYWALAFSFQLVMWSLWTTFGIQVWRVAYSMFSGGGGAT